MVILTLQFYAYSVMCLVIHKRKLLGFTSLLYRCFFFIGILRIFKSFSVHIFLVNPEEIWKGRVLSSFFFMCLNQWNGKWFIGSRIGVSVKQSYGEFAFVTRINRRHGNRSFFSHSLLRSKKKRYKKFLVSWKTEKSVIWSLRLVTFFLLCTMKGKDMHFLVLLERDI